MRVFLGAVLIVLVLGAVAGAGEPLDGAIAEGRTLAEQLCARCHAIGLEGESPFEPAPPFRTFAEKWPVDSLAEAFAEGIVVGHPAMPEFQLEVGQIDALLVYLESLEDR